jgi:hypothetical protein
MKSKSFLEILIKKHLDLILVFLFSIILFPFIICFVANDIIGHIGYVKMVNLGQITYPGNFLFYFLANLISGFTSNSYLLYGAVILLLASATAAKYELTKRMIFWFSGKEPNAKNIKLVQFISFMCILSFPIPDLYNLGVMHSFFHGRIAHNVWHNSTIIFLFPFALLLFWKQTKLLMKKGNPTSRDILHLTILVLLNAFIKPSFILVFIPATFLFLVWKYLPTDMGNFIKQCIPLFVGLIALVWLHFLIYTLQTGRSAYGPSSIAISGFFEVLRGYMPGWYIPVLLVMSFAFPILAAVLDGKSLSKNKAFIFALILTILGLVIFALVVEEGPRKYHGNLGQQNIICAYLLLVTAMSNVIGKTIDTKHEGSYFTWHKYVFVAQFLSGIAYFIWMFVTGSFA